MATIGGLYEAYKAALMGAARPIKPRQAEPIEIAVASLKTIFVTTKNSDTKRFALDALLAIKQRLVEVKAEQDALTAQEKNAGKAKAGGKVVRHKNDLMDVIAWISNKPNNDSHP